MSSTFGYAETNVLTAALAMYITLNINSDFYCHVTNKVLDNCLLHAKDCPLWSLALLVPHPRLFMVNVQRQNFARHVADMETYILHRGTQAR